MSNLENDPREVLCENNESTAGIEILAPRDVPLGGPRAMSVRRTLPQRQRSLIGSWCFLDHYGPDLVSVAGGMNVARHPHTGLATVSWLFAGEIEHRDSTGCTALVQPGDVNLMIAGRGVSHQELSTDRCSTLHGVQLWYALPETTRHREASFERYTATTVRFYTSELRVFIGSMAGSTSPVTTHTPPLVAAEGRISAGETIELELDPSFEYGILLDSGDLAVNQVPVEVDHLVYLPVGQTSITLQSQNESARVLILGGEPLREEIVMWWNFVGRTHDEIVAYRTAWQAEIAVEPAQPPADDTYSDGVPYPRFGPFPADTPAPLPAPALPNVRLRPRATGDRR